ncbi:ABC transporter ATP-binding protein [Bacteroidia bacterium]|nr:ABC transporter ATP-binding protein [Bacteroidia bacterium]
MILFDNSTEIVNPGTMSMNPDILMQYASYYLNIFKATHGKIATLTLIVAIVGGSYLMKNICAYLASFVFIKIKNTAVQRIRVDIYEKLLILPLSFFKKNKKGDILARTTSDIQNIDNNILSQIDTFANDFFTILLMLIVLFFISIQLSLFTILLLPPIIYAISFFAKKLKRPSAAMQKSLGELVSASEESISGVKVIKSYNADSFWNNRFFAINKNVFKNSNSALFRSELASPISEFLGTVAIMSILVLGGYMIFGGSKVLTPELFLTFLLILSQLLNPARTFSTGIYGIARGKVSVNRLKEILFADEVITEVPNATEIKDFNNCIEYKNVVFNYDETTDDNIQNIDASNNNTTAAQRKYVLDIEYLKFEKGKYYAIVGHSGSGKTTLIDLLSRFYDCSTGEIVIDGQNIKGVKINSLRNLFSYVSQDTILFNDTVANNIAFGNKIATIEQIKKCAELAYADEFIMNMENGYDTIIGDMGMKLSGGQRQRLSIARAILKGSPIIVFDEATSALDNDSEQKIKQAITQLSHNYTLIVIAHRLSSINDADSIIVLSQGKIVEQGTATELLSINGGYYQKLASII